MASAVQTEFFDLMSALEEENPVPDANASLNETSWGLYCHSSWIALHATDRSELRRLTVEAKCALVTISVQTEFFDLMSALEEENPVPDANASLNETSWGGIL
jgi:hypothetical protein